MKYKKILLGSLAVGITTLVPIATIVSCGSTSVKPKITKVPKPGPTTTKGTVFGTTGDAHYLKPELTGTTTTYKVTKGEKGKLKKGDKIQVTYKLKDNYTWVGGKRDDATSIYTVNEFVLAVKKPGATTTAVTMGGYEGNGTAFANDLKGTTIEGDTENLSNGNTVTFTYTLKTGYAWEDGTITPATSVYTVVGLNPALADPTTTSAKITFTGASGSGTFKLPTYTNTTSAYVESGGQTTKTVPTNLSNGNTVKILFTANTGYAFTGDTGMEFELAYTVSGLTKVSIPSKNAFSIKLDNAVKTLLGKPANLYYDAIYKIISDYSNGGYTPTEIKGLSSMTITVKNYDTSVVIPNDTTTTIPKKTTAIINIRGDAVINDISMSIDEDIVV